MAATDSHTGWGAQTETPFAADARLTSLDDGGAMDPLADEPRWPAWKVTIAVVAFCAAFWSGIGYLAVQILG